jgi:hypothetical protein
VAKRKNDLLEKRMTNLARANEVRLYKADFKRDLRRLEQPEACRLLADRLTKDPDSIRSFSVQELLLCIDGIGKHKATAFARAADWTNLTDKVSRLTPSRRDNLARVLRARADEVEARVRAA